MKRNLLVILMAFAYSFVSAQVVFYVEPPSPLEGNYGLTYADIAGGDWGVSDLLDPANAVVGGELAMALDGSADADSLVCEPPVISDVDGKVAVLYRGACEFGAKALAAQDAGAIAVVIINNGGLPIEMGGGADGGSVTIPVVMISTADGALLRDAIIAGGLTVFIGNKNGFYANDLGIKSYAGVRTQYASNIALLSQDDTEFDAMVGAWITNFGSNDQTGVTLTATIDFDGGNLYTETSDPVNILSGDSVYVSLPTFSQSSYDLGMYNFSYMVESDAEDEFPADNMYLADFRISEGLFSYAEIADEEEGPSNVKYTSPATITGEVHSCIHFQDPNASRVVPLGLTYSCSTFGEGLDGEVVSVYLYEWSLEFENIEDEAYTGIDEGDLDLLASGVYEYIGDDESGLNVYTAFEDIVELDDNARYLFCIAYDSEVVRHGHDVTRVDYAETQNQYLQPMYPNTGGGDWFLNGFGTDWTPGIAIHMVDANSLGIEDEVSNSDITPYPNPAVDFIQIPLKNVSGLTSIQVFDVSGKLVETLAVSVTPGEVLRYDVTSLDRGMYTFGLRYENGNVSNFNVVITK